LVGAAKAVSHYAQFRPGQKVRTKFGDIRTVREQTGSQVFVEEPDLNGLYNAGQLSDWQVTSATSWDAVRSGEGAG
jgi:hypothetical protein